MKRVLPFAAVAVLVALLTPAFAEEAPWSVRMADSAMRRWPQGRIAQAGQNNEWSYDLGTLLEGFDSVWRNTADAKYYRYIQSAVDQFVREDGSIATRDRQKYRLDDILLGRQLLLLYGVTREVRYAKAARALYEQLQQQPRTREGGFWHKRIYPEQMWLDGLYMAEPFYAEYAATFHHPEAYSDIARQFTLIDEHVRDAKSGLLRHGWDASKRERWADKQSGVSPQVWGRGLGWYLMALVDTLAYLPPEDASHAQLLRLLARDAEAVARAQDPASGLWFQVVDRPQTKGNYLEASASCMFVYALARGVREGYLPARYRDVAWRGYAGIVKRFVRQGAEGETQLTGTVQSVGLGGDPYRDGSLEYYLGAATAVDDPRGVGAFLLASTEMEAATTAGVGLGSTVLMDAWFNRQTRPDAFGVPVSFHYKWNDQSNSGFSLLGNIFRNYGARTATLDSAPTRAALDKAQVYLIVSPDIPAKNPKPNYMSEADADAIEPWVKAGGVLVLMENDPGNADLDHLNRLAERFGIHFNTVLRNTVEGNHFEQGKVSIAAGGPIFHAPHTSYWKEICTIETKEPAVAVLRDRGEILIATAKVGRGTVLAVVDPWLYNEYTDGRKLPAEYDNFGAGKELARWILEQVPPAAGAKGR